MGNGAAVDSHRVVTFSARTWAIAGGAILLLLVLLGLQLASIESQRKRVTSQERIVRRLVEDSKPALREARPLIGDTRALIGDARALAKPLTGASRDITDFIRYLQPLLESLDGKPLALVEVATSVLKDVEEQDLVRIARRDLELVPEIVDLLRTTVGIQRATLRTQRETLELQRRSVQIQEETLGIQREALVHIRSLDAKTGGPVAGPPGPATGAR